MYGNQEGRSDYFAGATRMTCAYLSAPGASATGWINPSLTLRALIPRGARKGSGIIHLCHSPRGDAMATRFCHYAIAILIACAILSLSQGSARGGVVVTWGDTIRHVGDVAAEQRPNVGAGKVGHKSSYFGVFWIDLWTWGGEFCVYEGDRYQPISRAEAARLIGKPESEV